MQTIICSKTALQRNAHEQNIICRQLFAVLSANQNDGKNNMNDNISYMFIPGRPETAIKAGKKYRKYLVKFLDFFCYCLD
jgi:hypothetical protein